MKNFTCIKRETFVKLIVHMLEIRNLMVVSFSNERAFYPSSFSVFFQENLLNGPSINSQSNGTVRISLNGTTNLSKNFAKSTNDLSGTGNNNRVMININSMADKKATMDSLNGILKNGNGNHNIASHRPVVHQKSITFGEM